QTAGNANILAIGWNDALAGISAVGDSAGNVYHVAVPTFRGNGMSQVIYYAADIKGGSNVVTVTFDQPAVYIDLRLAEYSGLMRTNAFDAGASASAIGANADSGSVTTSATNELLFGAGMTATTFTAPGSGFTQRVITAPDADIIEDQAAARVETYSATAALSSGAWLMQVAAFKAALPATAPTLGITPTATNAAVVMWPAAATGFTLQENPNLAATNWVDSAGATEVVGAENQVVLSLSSSSQRFYRLKSP
ncbi:MAG: hypothetical protein DME21_07435, partial [Verrucomicrobia bacterium]